MPLKKIRIATRKSPLALWQAEHVQAELIKYHPELEIELVRLQTQGDLILDRPLSMVGGKGLFIKELEQALYDNNADIAVHSMKDVTVDMPEGLVLPVMLKRENPHDVFISTKYKSIDELPQGALVGTSSLRRKCQLKAWRKDLNIKDLRGNVGTRLQKLNDGEYDAIILAAAGVIRLGLKDRISEFISTDIILPAIGQGAIGIQMRSGDDAVMEKISSLNDDNTNKQVETERIVSRRLFGGCQLPIAAYAEIDQKNIKVRGMVGREDGSEIIRESVSGFLEEREALGLQLAESLLKKGADEILKELLDD
ncbi:MAG: hydroxymethylbilane synthase [Gammaproteobacteria bacterium]|jgi:hydroxymethylbilane synthase